MTPLVEKALAAKRESKHIEFKQGFDPASPQDWCELIKDIVAIANSGGGIIVFGLSSTGEAVATSLDGLSKVDPAEFSDRIGRYIGSNELEFEILSLKKQKQSLVGFLVSPSRIPLVFEKPGTYDIGAGKQRTAFGVGTLYFRHGAKSEPASTNDIRAAIERQLEFIRKSWVKGVRQVIEAPAGSRIITVAPGKPGHVVLADKIRVVKNDPGATPVVLTRDASKASGSFVHEEISEGIFDEINNVIDANRVLARGQQHFFLGQPVYYRIYAERQHVSPRVEDLALLFRSAVWDFYGPALFWMTKLSPEIMAETFLDLYLIPKNPQIHFLMRTAILAGPDLCSFFYDRWHAKWKRHPQPPSFYWTFKEMIDRMGKTDARIAAIRSAPTTQIVVKEQTGMALKDLLDNSEQAASLLSRACMQAFAGDGPSMSTARALDVITYGEYVSAESKVLTKAITRAIGKREAGDAVDATSGSVS